MSVSSAGPSSPIASTMSRMSEAGEGPGPDKVKDHDADNAGAVRAPVKAAPAPSTGRIVDITV